MGVSRPILAATDFHGLQLGNILTVLAISTIAAVVLAALVALVLRLDSHRQGVFVQVGFRGNMAFVGLPVIIFAVLCSLGGALIELEMRGSIGLARVAGGFKVVTVPLITYGLAILWGLPADQLLVTMVFAACPVATASYIPHDPIGRRRGLGGGEHLDQHGPVLSGVGGGVGALLRLSSWCFARSH